MPLGTTTTYCRIPKLNPLRWLKYENNALNDFYLNEINEFEQSREYLQPFEKTDPINAQIQILAANVVSYRMELIDHDFNVKATATAQTLYTDPITGFRYIHFNMIPTAVAEGCYYGLITLSVNDGYMYRTERYISEPISLKTTHENTLAIDYRNDENDFDMLFQPVTVGVSSFNRLDISTSKGALYRLRVFGGLWSKDLKTGTDDVIYIDQTHDARILHSVPFNIFTWSFGSARGVPEWVYDKLVRIWCCSDVQVNGTYYTKNDGAAIEVETTDRYPMRSCRLETLKKENTYTDDYSIIVRKKQTGIGFMTIGFDFVIS